MSSDLYLYLLIVLAIGGSMFCLQLLKELNERLTVLERKVAKLYDNAP